MRGSGSGRGHLGPRPRAGRSRTQRVVRLLVRGLAGLVRLVVCCVRALPRTARALANMPNPRLTALGAGLFCVAVMVLLGYLVAVLGAAKVVYGVLFLPVSALTALWVRRADLLTAPVAVPLGFAAGALPLSWGSAGFGTQVMALCTTLAVHAGWLYGGTLIAGVIATVRKIKLLMHQVDAQRRCLAARAAAQPNGPTPRTGPTAPAAGAGTGAGSRGRYRDEGAAHAAVRGGDQGWYGAPRTTGSRTVPERVKAPGRRAGPLGGDVRAARARPDERRRSAGSRSWQAPPVPRRRPG